jgi:hypothetical protein
MSRVRRLRELAPEPSLPVPESPTPFMQRLLDGAERMRDIAALIRSFHPENPGYRRREGLRGRAAIRQSLHRIQ